MGTNEKSTKKKVGRLSPEEVESRRQEHLRRVAGPAKVGGK